MLYENLGELLVQLIVKLSDVLQRQVKGKGIQEHLIRELAFENTMRTANQSYGQTERGRM